MLREAGHGERRRSECQDRRAGKKIIDREQHVIVDIDGRPLVRRAHETSVQDRDDVDSSTGNSSRSFRSLANCSATADTRSETAGRAVRDELGQASRDQWVSNRFPSARRSSELSAWLTLVSCRILMGMSSRELTVSYDISPLFRIKSRALGANRTSFRTTGRRYPVHKESFLRGVHVFICTASVFVVFVSERGRESSRPTVVENRLPIRMIASRSGS